MALGLVVTGTGNVSARVAIAISLFLFGGFPVYSSTMPYGNHTCKRRTPIQTKNLKNLSVLGQLFIILANTHSQIKISLTIIVYMREIYIFALLQRIVILKVPFFNTLLDIFLINSK